MDVESRLAVLEDWKRRMEDMMPRLLDSTPPAVRAQLNRSNTVILSLFTVIAAETTALVMLLTR